MKFLKDNRSGQSLAEVLIATAITALLVVAAVSLISPVLRNDRYASRNATSGALSRELLDNVKSVGEADWHNLSQLSMGSSSPYYLITSSSPFTIATGTQALTLGSTTYTRYFYVDQVRRDTATQNVTTSIVGSTVDPATLSITAVTQVPQGATSTISQIITRSQNSVFIQSDWSGGGGFVPSSTTSTINQYQSSSNINSTGTPGSIQIDTL